MEGERSCLCFTESLFSKYLSSTFCVPGVVFWLRSSGSSRLEDGALLLCRVPMAVMGKGQANGEHRAEKPSQRT